LALFTLGIIPEGQKMSALTRFHAFVQSLSSEQREQLGSRIKTMTEELLEARSEEARLRLVEEYIHALKRNKPVVTGKQQLNKKEGTT
jgi:hypothetical protein